MERPLAKPKSDDSSKNAEQIDVGFVYALGIEAGCMEDLLEDKQKTHGQRASLCRGRHGTQRIAVATVGVGAARAEEGTRTLIEAYQPRLIFSAGLGGALSPELRRHDIVLVDSVHEESGPTLALGLSVDQAWLDAKENVHRGALVTVGHVVRTRDEREALAERFGAIVVDMETAGVGRVCRELGTPLSAARIVSDSVEDELPENLESLMEQDATLARKLGSAARLLWNRPSAAMDLYRLRENALVASDRLARFLLDLVSEDQ